MELDLRKQKILQAIVQDYVTTAEPVGSHVLVERYSLGVKSATIRNEMAEMSDWGYLRQPHTSAGRVPSDRGYRFYVNRLMPLPVIQQGESDRIRRAVESASTEFDAILRRTCALQRGCMSRADGSQIHQHRQRPSARQRVCRTHQLPQRVAAAAAAGQQLEPWHALSFSVQRSGGCSC